MKQNKLLHGIALFSIFLTVLLNGTASFATGTSGSDLVFDNSITFTATLSNGSVVTNWSKYNHAEAFTYYKVVRSQTNNNPVYPDDGYIYFGSDMNTLTYTDNDVPNGTSYYRVCQVADGKRYCSANVVTIVNGSTNGNGNTSFTTLTLTGNSNGNTISLSWNVNGTSPNGLKVVWADHTAPVYPGDNYHYLTDPAVRSDVIGDLGVGTYYVRVCVYNGNGVCLSYSNELTFTIGGNSNTNATNTNTNGGYPKIGNCQIFPNDNPWNRDISSDPVDPNSANYINSIGSNGFLHADFGGNGAYGIPYVVVDNTQARLPITFTEYGDESDPGPYPIPLNAPIEGGSSSQGDRHVISVDKDACKLYELYHAYPTTTGWEAGSGAKFDLTSNALRPDGWTSADAAGLPIFPGLARYDEVTAGQIDHALRFTVQRTQKKYIYPATHYASSSTDPNLPPMGLRLRLKADYDISGYTGQSRVILEALKKYGMIVADNGSNWFITGASDTRWNDEDLNQLKTVPGSAFEAVTTVEPSGTGTSNSSSVSSFTDVPSTHWASSYIGQLHTEGVVQGSGGLFYPDSNITRAEFLKMLMEALFPGLASGQVFGTNFSDVSSASWYAPYIVLADNKGIVSGYTDRTFKPNNPITRAEAVAIIAKALQLKLNINPDIPFRDVSEAWQKQFIGSVMSLQIISGYDSTHFGPNDMLTRAQAAKMVYKAQLVKQ